MPEIIPAIIAKSYEELESLVQKVEPYVNRVHIDIMDGKFVTSQTISGPYELKQLIPTLLNKKMKFEIHLMVENPHERLNEWLATPVDKYLVHWESTQENFQEMAQIIQGAQKQIGIVLNPDTEMEILDAHIDNIDLVQLMSVQPGFYGREFIRYTISRISHIKELYPTKPIQIDGGINLENAKMCVDAGASILVSGSYIFNSPDIGKAIEELRLANNQ